MRDQGSWTGGSGDYASRGEARVSRARYSVRDLSVLVWRERLTVVLVFAVVLLVGAGLAMTLPKTYTAHSSLLIQLGQEYVYEPRAGDAGRGAVPQKDEVVQSEAEILSSDELKRRTVRAVGLNVIDPRLAADWAGADAAKRRDIEASALKIMTTGLSVETAPDTGVIKLGFKHKDPEAAAAILNSLVATYLSYRREIFANHTSPAVSRERDAFTQRLEKADDAYAGFLQSHGVADFTTEKASLAATYQSIFDEKFKADAQAREVEGRLATLKARQPEAPQEIEIQRDLDLSIPAQLLKLQSDRQDLLARYTPDAQPVKDIEARITQLQALVSSGRSVGEKDKRLGANPVWQGIETQRIGLEAEVTALNARRNELARELAEIQSRQMRLTRLESQFQTLSADRDALQGIIKSSAVRDVEARAAEDILKGADDHIRVVARATPPAEGKSLKKIVFGLAFLFAAFTAVCAGLLKVFSRRGFATASSVERTLDLPVLATAPMKY